MASLQKKADSWHLQFTYRRERRTWVIGPVDDDEAEAVRAKVQYLLMRIKQNLVQVPRGMDIVKFLQFDGNPPKADKALFNKELLLCDFSDAYLKTVGNGSIEANTLYTSKIHLAHVAGTLGKQFPIASLILPDLQRHIERRVSKDKVASVTIKKELDTFRAAWNWGIRMNYVAGPFPSIGLVYPKTEDKLPFMTWEEIETRIAEGGDPDQLWEALYLTDVQLDEFLEFAEAKKAPYWVYPMCVLAAHTGARRSEMARAQRQDVDFAAGIITIREKKRVRGRLTTRRAPISTRLKKALASLPNNGAFLFGKHPVQAIQKAFTRLVGKHTSGAANLKTKKAKEAARRTKWAVIPGWHCLRHSCISLLANKGIDQRIIQDMVGHMTASMQARYAHLYPSTKHDAVKRVFG